MRAQQAKGMLRVGMVGFVPRTSPLFTVFPRRLAELGYREGENLIIDYVQAAGTDKALDAGYREVAARKPDILMAIGPEAALKAALASTQTTPIVMFAIDFDPIAQGYVSSLVRPGGRITGLYFQQIELVVKRQLAVIRDYRTIGEPSQKGGFLRGRRRGRRDRYQVT